MVLAYISRAEDVERDEADDPLGMVEREAMRTQRAAVMGVDEEARLMAERDQSPAPYPAPWRAWR